MLRQTLIDCRRLLSVRGEANSPERAASIAARLDALDDAQRGRFFERLADLSAKGLKQSAGLMVNYLYDLARTQRHHDRFAHGEVVRQPRGVCVALKI